MKRPSLYCALVLAALALGSAVGCSKKTPEAAAASEIAAIVAKLPEAAAVKTAFDKKDYDAVMAEVLKIKPGITTDEKQIQFLSLTSWLKQQLLDASLNDPKAAEALNALRAMSATR